MRMFSSKGLYSCNCSLVRKFAAKVATERMSFSRNGNLPGSITLLFDQMNQLEKVVDHFRLLDFVREKCFDILVAFRLLEFVTDELCMDRKGLVSSTDACEDNPTVG